MGLLGETCLYAHPFLCNITAKLTQMQKNFAIHASAAVKYNILSVFIFILFPFFLDFGLPTTIFRLNCKRFFAIMRYIPPKTEFYTEKEYLYDYEKK